MNKQIALLAGIVLSVLTPLSAGPKKGCILICHAFEPCADTNEDGLINIQDMIEVLSNWGEVGTNYAADANNDDMIDAQDLRVVIRELVACRRR